MSLYTTLKSHNDLLGMAMHCSFADKNSGALIEQDEFAKQLAEELEQKKQLRAQNSIEESEVNFYQDFFNFFNKFDVTSKAGISYCFSALKKIITDHKFEEEKFFDQFLGLANQPATKRYHSSSKNLSYIPESLKIKNNGSLCNLLIKHNPNELKFVPPTVIKNNINLYKEIVKENPRTLDLIPADIDGYDKFCSTLFHENQDITLLGLVPYEKRTYDLCKTAVKNNAGSLEFIPETIKKIKHQYSTLADLAIAKDGLSLQHIDLTYDSLTPKQYYNLCEKAVNQNSQSFEYIAPDTMNKQKYIELCKVATDKDPSVLVHIRDNIQIENPEIVQDAVQKNITLLEYVASEIKDKILENLDNNVFQSASQQPEGIKYIPEEKRSLEIKQNALLTNFSDKKYIKQAELDQLANTITKTTQKMTIIVVNDNDFEDKEVSLSRKIYANKHQVKNEHVIAVENSDLPQLLSYVERNNKNEPIKLVILGHGNKAMEEFAGFSPSELTACVEEHPSISKIVLLGCNTAAATASPEEQKNVSEFVNSKIKLDKIIGNKKEEKEIPLGKNIKTEDSSLLKGDSFLKKIFESINEKLPERRIEIKGSTRPLFPDPIKGSFQTANKDIKKKEGKPFEIDETKRLMDVKTRLQQWHEKEKNEEKDTLGKYFTIIKPGK